MFFVKTGSVIAWVATFGGAAKLIAGFLLAFTFSGENNAAAARRYFNASNTGEIINEGTMLFVGGVLIGLLVHIAKKIDGGYE